MIRFWLWASWLWAGVAWADKKHSPPVTCQAVYVGPSPYCSWEDTYAAAGSGPNQKRAARAATQRLLAGVQQQAQARVIQTEGTLAAARAVPELESCPTAVEEHMRLSCFPDAALREPLTCYAEFDARGCWRPQMVVLEDIGWRAMEKARSAICERVATEMTASALSPAEQRSCVARCHLEAQLRCPALATAEAP